MRSPKKIVYLILLGAVLIGIGFVLGKSSARPVSEPPLVVSPSPKDSIFKEPTTQNTREKSKVLRIIDGDTIEVRVNDEVKKIRYIGIDTPETVDPRKPVQCFGREAAVKNRELVFGKEVELEKDVSETDKFGRLLRYVFVNDTFVNELLVREGYAFSSTFPPDVKYQDLFTGAEREARENNRGLWGGCQGNGQGSSTESAQTVQGLENVQKEGCLIKGNISSSGKIYHLPGCGSYERTVINESQGERWFCTEKEAIEAGWRKAKNCP